MKYAFIQTQAQYHATATLCRVLGVSRSGFYTWQRRQPSLRAQYNQQLLTDIRKIHVESLESYGSPRVHVELKACGHTISRGRVERLMRCHGIQAKRARRHRSVYAQRQMQAPVENRLNREFWADEPNEKWVSDITFIETREGWLYLAMVLDLYSRAVIGWSMSEKINGQLVQDALAMALVHRCDRGSVLVHSDQGSQYTAAAYRDQLAANNLICSMSRKGECHDNAVAESFFSTLKAELVDHQDYRTRNEARQSIFKYIELFYNRKRRHSYLNYQSPLDYEKQNAA